MKFVEKKSCKRPLRFLRKANLLTSPESRHFLMTVKGKECPSEHLENSKGVSRHLLTSQLFFRLTRVLSQQCVKASLTVLILFFYDIS